jgi:pimeloyl-ACP methyl ester carboxylesterase
VSILDTLRLAAGPRPRATLIALPGFMESAASLLPTLGHWAEQGFDILAIDPRGHGSSPRWTDALLQAHPGDVIVEDILATLAEAPLAEGVPLVFFGHSAGGATAAAVAAALSHRVRAVILEDPFWRLPVTQFQAAAAAEAAHAGLQRLKAMDQAERMADISAVYPQWPANELVAWSRAKDDVDPSVVANGHIIPSRGWPSLLAELGQADVPVLVITGTLCIGMTANHRAMLRALGAEVVVVRGATHFVRRDDRDLFHALADDFLNRQVPRPHAIARTTSDKSMLRAPRQLQPLGGPSWPE